MTEERGVASGRDPTELWRQSPCEGTTNHPVSRPPALTVTWWSASAKKSQPAGPPASHKGTFGVLQFSAVNPSPEMSTLVSGAPLAGEATTLGSPAGRRVVVVVVRTVVLVVATGAAVVVVVVVSGTDVLMPVVLVAAPTAPTSDGSAPLQAPSTTSAAPAATTPRRRRRVVLAVPAKRLHPIFVTPWSARRRRV